MFTKTFSFGTLNSPISFNQKKRDNMSNNAMATPSVTSSRGFESSHMTWVRSQQKNRETFIQGRIKDTGANYIVEGWEVGNTVPVPTRWVKVPCANLATAQMMLGLVMDKETFDKESHEQANKRLIDEILADLGY